MADLSRWTGSVQLGPFRFGTGARSPRSRRVSLETLAGASPDELAEMDPRMFARCALDLFDELLEANYDPECREVRGILLGNPHLLDALDPEERARLRPESAWWGLPDDPMFHPPKRS
jgi:hypothetical protein